MEPLRCATSLQSEVDLEDHGGLIVPRPNHVVAVKPRDVIRDESMVGRTGQTVGKVSRSIK